MSWLDFDPARTIATLARHSVEFVMIGGYAAALHGSPLVTNDADICPLRSPDNLAKLAAALRELDAKIYSDAAPEGLAFDCSAEFLDGVELVNLITTAGRLDVSYRPSGTDGYDDLVQRAERYEFGGVPADVASLDDIIRSKRAADRPKDRVALPILEALRDEIDRLRGI